MNDRHMSTQFDAELSGISTRVLEMGGMVESQVARAVHALVNFSSEVASEVLATEEKVNQTEVAIDLDLSTIIARRQPTARDLRLLIAISKTIVEAQGVQTYLPLPELKRSPPPTPAAQAAQGAP
jgi:phosphate transport system protein